MRANRMRWMVAVPAVLVGLLCTASMAGPINYGDFMANTVWYRNVTEDSGTDPTPLYGTPHVSANSLDFDPVSFNSFSTGAADSDITDGTLGMVIEAKPGNGINKILYSEAGDFTLIGFGTDNTLAGVTSSFFVDILEVDGVGINPINLNFVMPITPDNGLYRLVEQGGGPFESGNWTGDLMIDIVQALNDAGQAFNLGATRVAVVLDNSLVTLSEDGTSSFIAKKDFGGTSITVIPEPTSWLLAALAVAGFAAAARRR